MDFYDVLDQVVALLQRRRRVTYRALKLQFKLDDELSLECLRIPHFYRAFYVYKYATGLSAAIALSQRVLGGGKTELNQYLSFLKGGCSKDPLDLLRDAGVARAGQDRASGLCHR